MIVYYRLILYPFSDYTRSVYHVTMDCIGLFIISIVHFHLPVTVDNHVLSSVECGVILLTTYNHEENIINITYLQRCGRGSLNVSLLETFLWVNCLKMQNLGLEITHFGCIYG